MALTAAQVRQLKQPGRYGDGGGLYLVIRPNGTKTWVQRVYVGGRRVDRGLGKVERVTLTAARSSAEANRVAVREGRDPWAEGMREVMPDPSAVTFRDLTLEVHALNKVVWRSEKHAENWLRTLENHVFPTLGDMPVDEISRSDVVDVLNPIWTTKPETARRVRQRMRDVFTRAIAKDIIDFNPAGEAVKGAFPSMPRLVHGHFRAVPHDRVAKSLEAIRWSDSMLVTRLSFQLLVHTAARSGEVRLMEWREVDLKGHLWTIPAARMKAKRPHRVPLSVQAGMLLDVARERLHSEAGLVFPGPGGKPLSDNAFSSMMRRLQLEGVPHGFRSAFRDWCAETRVDRDLAELSLAHTIGSPTEQAYNRTDLLDLRRDLMQRWSDYLDPLPF